MAKEITKKNNKRIVIVLAFILLVLLIGYIYFRGQYLEILEIGEKYTEIFWQNVKSVSYTHPPSPRDGATSRMPSSA